MRRYSRPCFQGKTNQARRYHCIHFEWPKSKTLTSNAGEDLQQATGTCIHSQLEWKLVQLLCKTVCYSFTKLNILYIQSTNHVPCYLPNRVELSQKLSVELARHQIFSPHILYPNSIPLFCFCPLKVCGFFWFSVVCFVLLLLLSSHKSLSWDLFQRNQNKRNSKERVSFC